MPVTGPQQGVRPGVPGAGGQPPRPGPPPHRPEVAVFDDVPDGDGTGHPAVDAALQAIDNAGRLSPAEQVAAYEQAHATLQETLASIDRA